MNKTYRDNLRAVMHRVFADIARQVPLIVDGKRVPQRAAEAAYKQAFKTSFLGGRSTESLTDEQLRTFTLRVEAHAAQYMGVEFREREAA